MNIIHWGLFSIKRFYNRETIRGTRISQLAEIHPVFHDSLR